jgi:hypothetical protein
MSWWLDLIASIYDMSWWLDLITSIYDMSWWLAPFYTLALSNFESYFYNSTTCIKGLVFLWNYINTLIFTTFTQFHTNQKIHFKWNFWVNTHFFIGRKVRKICLQNHPSPILKLPPIQLHYAKTSSVIIKIPLLLVFKFLKSFT